MVSKSSNAIRTYQSLIFVSTEILDKVKIVDIVVPNI